MSIRTNCFFWEEKWPNDAIVHDGAPNINLWTISLKLPGLIRLFWTPNPDIVPVQFPETWKVASSLKQTRLRKCSSSLRRSSRLTANSFFGVYHLVWETAEVAFCMHIDATSCAKLCELLIVVIVAPWKQLLCEKNFYNASLLCNKLHRIISSFVFLITFLNCSKTLWTLCIAENMIAKLYIMQFSSSFHLHPNILYCTLFH
jgi:hypothetical protein